MTQEERDAVQRWKDANGYDDLLAAYSATVDERNSLATQLEQMRRERDALNDTLTRALSEQAAAVRGMLGAERERDEARAKLARVREMVDRRHDIGINGLAIATLRIIDEKEGGM